MRRVVVMLSVMLLAILMVITALTYRLFVWPETDSPSRVDAVVVFAGGNGERQEQGRRLVNAGIAPVLVISHGGRPQSKKYALCKRRSTEISVICLDPKPPTTNGEARAFAALAQERGWRSLAVVTSTIHVRRASMLLARCHGGDIYTVATPLTNEYRHEMAPQVLHEWGGLLAALTVRRDC